MVCACRIVTYLGSSSELRSWCLYVYCFTLDGDPQKIWEKLSEKERQEFTTLVKEQKLSDIVDEWLPWWTYKVSGAVVTILFTSIHC